MGFFHVMLQRNYVPLSTYDPFRGKVLEIAFNYIKDNLNIENALGIRDLCLSFDQLEIVENCDEFVVSHFEDVSKSQTFKQIKFKYLEQLIKSDDLVVKDEKRIFEIVVQWIEVDIQNRIQKGQQLLKVVRFPLMPPEYLYQISSHKLIRNTKLFEKIVESIYYSTNKKFRMDQNILKLDDITQRKYINYCANEKLICIGGTDNQWNNVMSIEICSDFGSNQLDKINTGRFFFACCTYKNNIILIGGNGAPHLCTKYDPKNKTLNELEPFPDYRYGHMATIINSELLVLGGLILGTRKSLISINLDEKMENGEIENHLQSQEMDLPDVLLMQKIFYSFDRDADIGKVLSDAFDNKNDSDAMCLARTAQIIRTDMFQELISFNGSFSSKCQEKSLSLVFIAMVSMLLDSPNILKQTAHPYIGANSSRSTGTS
ncbi:Kelch-like protein 1 [Nymphon striatum]|nr:Kelch-like protein 1 [Nymphon striatum]